MFANVSLLDEHDNPIYLAETFVANFVPGTSQSAIDSMNLAHGVVVLDSLFDDPYWLLLKLTPDSDLDVLSMGNHYHESSLVRYAKAGMGLNFTLSDEPVDEYWSYQWHFLNTGQTGGTPDADIDLDEAFDFWHSASAFVTVAILDDGFAPHEDFPASRIIGGWDYYQNNANFSPATARNHGMAVMGIIGTETLFWNEMPGSYAGLAGISDHVRIIGQKITNDNGSMIGIMDSQIADAISEAALGGARIISNSWGCSNCFWDTTAYWIRKADSMGVSITASTGNFPALYSDTVQFPARQQEVIAVGAVDSSGARWHYSGSGPSLDVMAPSAELQYKDKRGNILYQGHFWSLDQMGTLGVNSGGLSCWTSDLDYDCTFGGTSAACPQVAGVIAMILMRRPDLVGQTALIRDIIRYSADRTPWGHSDTSRVNDQVGWGRLNAARALLAVVRGDADNSGGVTISDANYLINFIFAGGPAPVPHQLTGDTDGNGIITISDAVYIIDYIFAGGPPPRISFSY